MLKLHQGTVGVEINGNAGMDYVQATEGKWVVDLAAITAAQGFAHLHCIKGANWANATVTRVELFKDEPAPAPTFGVESFVGYSYEGLDNAVSDEFTATMVETLGLTGADGEKLERFDQAQNKMLTAKEIVVNRGGEEKIIQLPVDFVKGIVENKDEKLVMPRMPFIVGGFSDDSTNKENLKEKDFLVSVNGEEIKYYDQVLVVV